MRNNTLDKIQIQTAKLPVSRFNMSNDVSLTTQFGVVTPTHVKYMHAGTKKVVGDESLFYLAPMVVPTFSRIKAKLYHQFVALSDLLPHSFNSRMSGTPFNAPKVGNRVKTENMPFINLRMLSCLALFGSRLSLWYGSVSSTSPTKAGLTDPTLDGSVYSCAKYDSPNTTSTIYTEVINQSRGLYSASGSNNGVYSVLSRSGANETASWASPSLNAFRCKCPTDTLLLNPYTIFGKTQPTSGKFLIPLGQQDIDSAFGDYSVNRSTFGIESYGLGQDPTFYNPETADVVIPFYFDYQDTTVGGSTQWVRKRIYFCFHLSDFGKRFKNFLEGCGFKLCFDADRYVSFLPLAAAYKAYYDLFSINIFENYENSELGFVLSAIDAGGFFANSEDLSGDLLTVNSVGAVARLCVMFGETFYTEEQDYISAHISNTGISNAAPVGMIRSDVVNTPHITAPTSYLDATPSPDSGTGHNAHAWINSAVHGQLDAEFLKKAYRWVNRNTIAGQRIAELLRAQGYGDYVDTCKSNFIGYDETPLVVSDVVSSSDTYNSASNSGAQLGQRGAKGIGYNEGKKSFTFEANEIGFWVTFLTIVPSSGYSQGIDIVNAGLVKKEGFYSPDFDSLGYQLNDTKMLVDSPKQVIPSKSNSKSFGFAPLLSHFKVAKNKIMGMFSAMSEQDNFLPYMLDKFMPLNKLRCWNEETISLYQKKFKLSNPLDIDNIPTAGEAWRYIGKYLFLENFSRMFSYQGVSSTLVANAVGNAWSEFVVRDADNFICHMIDNDQTYAHMKPIEESYETDDDGKTNSSMDKA